MGSPSDRQNGASAFPVPEGAAGAAGRSFERRRAQGRAAAAGGAGLLRRGARFAPEGQQSAADFFDTFAPLPATPG